MEAIPAFLFLVGVFALGVAHVNAIVNLALYGSIAGWLLFYSKRITQEGWRFLYPVGIFLSIYLALALFSLLFSIDVAKSFREIRGELLQNFFLLVASFWMVVGLKESSLRYWLLALAGILVLHMAIHLGIWVEHGGFPYRAGGLLDSGGGEKFGVWVLFFLGLSLALGVLGDSKILKILGGGLVLVALVAIVANNTRATLLGAIIMGASLLWLFKERSKRYLALGAGVVLVLVSLSLLYHHGERLGHRYNLAAQSEEIHHLFELSPAQMKDLEKEGIDHAIASRLAMWKSIVLALGDDPLTPRGYGRDLYKRTIAKEWSHTTQNIPYITYLSPHNAFLSMAYQLGILGLFWMVAWFGFLWRRSLLLAHSSSSYRWVGGFFFLGSVGLAVSIFFGDFFADSEARLFYILSGVMLALDFRSRQ